MGKAVLERVCRGSQAFPSGEAVVFRGALLCMGSGLELRRLNSYEPDKKVYQAGQDESTAQNKFSGHQQASAAHWPMRH